SVSATSPEDQSVVVNAHTPSATNGTSRIALSTKPARRSLDPAPDPALVPALESDWRPPAACDLGSAIRPSLRPRVGAPIAPGPPAVGVSGRGAPGRQGGARDRREPRDRPCDREALRLRGGRG